MKKRSSQWTQFMQLRKEAWKKFRTPTAGVWTRNLAIPETYEPTIDVGCPFSMSALERFVVLMSDHTNRCRRVNDARKVLAICTKGNKPWQPPLNWTCIISSREERCLQRWTLLGKVLGMGMIKIRVRCVEASKVHLTLNIKRYTSSCCAKPNEVAKDVEKVF